MTAISTVGYGNPFKDSTTRIMIITLLWFAIIFVPSKSSKLLSLLSSRSKYARRNYKATESVPHIIVTGRISSSAAEDFFEELFDEDHGT